MTALAWILIVIGAAFLVAQIARVFSQVNSGYGWFLSPGLYGPGLACLIGGAVILWWR